HVIDVPTAASIMATMIGLGVGIDYALFLLSRHRRLLAAGVPVEESIRRTVASSGGAVVFAGGTVVIALSALMLAGFPMLRTLGSITGISVVCAVLTSITLVPALLGLLGQRINALRLPFGGNGEHRATSGWARLGNWVAGRPWRVLVITLAVLAALAAPASPLKPGPLDDGYGDRGTPARRAYELLEVAFGPAANGPLAVAAKLDTKIDGPAPPVAQEIQRRVERVDGVAHVTEPQVSRDGRAVLVQAL